MQEALGEPLVVSFVGSHFGRKGGCVAVRMAELAQQRGFPLTVQIVSKLEAGGSIWTDPPQKALFEPYRKLLNLPNVRFYSGLPNHEVLALLRKSHFSILATFSDTFGYSAIESMMNYTPVIATRQGALPEFIRHGENGILLDLPVNELGEWHHQLYGPRRSKRYRENYFMEIERMAAETLAHLENIAGKPDTLRALRENARQEAVNKFDCKRASAYWDALYLEAANAS
jgi:glycosyltransferase involved in cell wall biosynthesis